MKKISFILIFFLLIPFKVLSSEIFIVDISFLLQKSEKGKKIQKDLDSLNVKQKKTLEKKQKELKKKESEIASKKNVLSQEDFKKEVEKFKAELNKFNNDRRKSLQEINKKKNNEIAKLLEEINNILVEYSKENNISTILDKKNVIITKIDNDITKKILTILNK